MFLTDFDAERRKEGFQHKDIYEMPTSEFIAVAKCPTLFVPRSISTSHGTKKQPADDYSKYEERFSITADEQNLSDLATTDPIHICPMWRSGWLVRAIKIGSLNIAIMSSSNLRCRGRGLIHTLRW